MMFRSARGHLVLAALLLLGYCHAIAGPLAPSQIGVVVMHGKGDSPLRNVADLASALANKGFQVVNPEMAWSGRRDYDVDVGTAEKEVEAALGTLRSKGARKLFLAGHGIGGLFALHLGGKLQIDGVIAIAPSGDVSSAIYRDRIGDAVEQARKMIAEGKGDDQARFADYEGSRGVYPLISRAANYLTWLDPEGAMNEPNAIRSVNPRVPVLFIVPTNDYPALQKAKQAMYSLLPASPRTRLYEPEANHLAAPSASREEIARWMMEAAN
jgi:alpha-beta hydrolase superfamily lysophospholipase